MTEFEMVKSLFDKLGIGYEIRDSKLDNTEYKTILLEVGSEKVNGYGGFYTEFWFTKDDEKLDEIFIGE